MSMRRSGAMGVARQVSTARRISIAGKRISTATLTPDPRESSEDVDAVLARVGGYRRWHLAMFVMLGLTMFIPLACQGLAIVFTGWTPPHHCKVPYGQYVNETIPVEMSKKGKSMYALCSMYTNRTIDNSTSTCSDGWTYNSEGFSTIVTEWDLVCDNNYLAELSQTMYQVGALIAEVTVSILIDSIGRKKIHIFSLFLVTVFGTALAFTQNYIAFVVLRPFIAVSVVAALNSGCTALMELFDSGRRSVVGIGLEAMWVLCYMYIALLGFLIFDWRKLQLIISLTNIIGIIYLWILPESVLWLLANGKDDEAEQVLHRMARYNGISVQGRLLLKPEKKDSLLRQNTVEDDTNPINADGSVNEKLAYINNEEYEVVRKRNLKKKEPPKERVLDLFLDPILRRFFIISSLLWFANNIVYYGLILSTPSLAGNRFMNFFLGGVVEIPAYALTLVIVQKIGRRIPTCVFHILAGVALTTTVFIPETTASGIDLIPAIIVSALFGKFAISASFAIIVLYTKEFFPTNLRGTSAGMCNILGRIGNMAAPFAAYAAREIPWLPMVVLAIISVLAGLTALLLPETIGKPLPQTKLDVYILFGEPDDPDDDDSDDEGESRL